MTEAAGYGGGGGGVSFPVVFFNGEYQTIIGDVVLHPTVDFKALQSVLSRKTGISPHQFSIYISNRKNRSYRSLITANVNLSSIFRERGGFFFVKLKRSWWSGARNGNNDRSSPQVTSLKKEPPGNAILLSRGGGGGGGDNFMDARAVAGLGENERRTLRHLQMEQKRYLVNLGRAKGLICEECDNANLVGRDVEFHCCVHDAVIFGFRSSDGLIARPGKDRPTRVHKGWSLF